VQHELQYSYQDRFGKMNKIAEQRRQVNHDAKEQEGNREYILHDGPISCVIKDEIRMTIIIIWYDHNIRSRRHSVQSTGDNYWYTVLLSRSPIPSLRIPTLKQNCIVPF